MFRLKKKKKNQEQEETPNSSVAFSPRELLCKFCIFFLLNGLWSWCQMPSSLRHMWVFLCLGEFLRSLPPLAKKYVLQMLYIDSPITAKSIEVWVLPDGYSKHRVAIDRLIQLRVFTETVDRYAASFSLHNISFENGRICWYIYMVSSCLFETVKERLEIKELDCRGD